MAKSVIEGKKQQMLARQVKQFDARQQKVMDQAKDVFTKNEVTQVAEATLDEVKSQATPGKEWAGGYRTSMEKATGQLESAKDAAREMEMEDR